MVPRFGFGAIIDVELLGLRKPGFAGRDATGVTPTVAALEPCSGATNGFVI